MKSMIAAVSGFAMLAGSAAILATPAEAQQRGAPRGSYARTCTEAYVNQGRLYADCRDTAGRMRSTSIEVNRCGNYDLSNRDGLLVCGPHRGTFENRGRPEQNNRPGGGWDNGPNRPGQGAGWNNDRGSQITVYRDSNYRGTSRTFDGSISNLRSSGLNDQISSIRLGRGTWEVCEHADFRGRCETVRDDVRDLSRLNLNDRISSLRPVGRR